MDNKIELIDRYQERGFKYVDCQAPFMLFIKVENKEIVDFEFVKPLKRTSNLTTEQSIWKRVLEKLNATVKVELTDV